MPLFQRPAAILIGCAAIALAAVPAHAQGFSVNATDSPINQIWYDTEAGWQVTPTSSFTLTNVVSKFNSDPFAAVCSVYAGLPSYLGGTLLSSSSFAKDDGEGNLIFGMSNPVTIIAGKTYFVDFTGIYGQGINVTDDAGAIKPGTEYYTLNGQYGSDNSDFYDQPILSLNPTPAAVPEAPSVVSLGVLLALGLGGLAVSARRRKVLNAK